MLAISNISKDFHINGKRLSILKDINIDVNSGEVLVILGMSGCGKSTLLKIIAGLVLPDSGQVLLEKKSIIAPTPEIGIVFQSYTVFPWMTVLKNIESGLNHSYIKNEDRVLRARKFLDLVGLSQYANVWPRTLSGGMQQRVALARTYAMNPKILLMDEPFGALDALTRRSMQKEFLHLHSSEKKLTIFVTHDIDEALIVGDRILILTPWKPARIIAEFDNNKASLNEELRLKKKNEIEVVFRTFEQLFLILAGISPDISDEVYDAGFVDATRKQIISDDNLAKSVKKLLDSWDSLSGWQRQYIANLQLAVLMNNPLYRKEIFEFAINKFFDENYNKAKVQLIFTAFHAGGGISDEYEDKLLPMLDWLGGHLQDFNSACIEYYGNNDEGSIKTLEHRLNDPIYQGALPLYFFNLSYFPEYFKKLKQILNNYANNKRKTIEKAIEIIENF